MPFDDDNTAGRIEYRSKGQIISAIFFLPWQKKFQERFDEIDLLKYICVILKKSILKLFVTKR
jgi:hypothetical protein